MGSATIILKYLHDLHAQIEKRWLTPLPPSQFYEMKGSTSTKHIYIPNGGLVATIEGISTTTARIFHTHLDHLEGTDAITNDVGQVTQVLNYYPYGSLKIDNSYGGYDTSKKYIGQEYDAETGLNYLGARYYRNDRGQFISQDPVFWEIGQTKDGIAVLINPQAQNSYSYAQNNPITNKDPDGRCGTLCLVLLESLAQWVLPSVAQAPASEEEQMTNSRLESGIFIAGFVSPYGRYNSLNQVLQKNFTQSAFVKQYGKDYGTKVFDVAKTYRDAGIKFDIHLAERTVDRAGLGITPENVIDTFKTGTKYFDIKNNNYSYFKDGLRIGVEKDGTVKTVVRENNINKDRFKQVED